MTEYTIVSDGGHDTSLAADALAAAVQSHMSQGWQPHGSVVVVPCGLPGDPNSGFILMQPMVRSDSLVLSVDNLRAALSSALATERENNLTVGTSFRSVFANRLREALTALDQGRPIRIAR